ncbi:MAG: hypothetical protein AAGN66_24075 [Acidobacteriota bacterium]
MQPNHQRTQSRAARAAITVAIAALLASPATVFGGSFIGASETIPDLILHPTGYTGTGGELTVGVCLDPASIELPSMEIPMRNVITIINELRPTTGNLKLGADSELQPDEVDWESTILHEVGHCIGLAHPNAATESGLAGNNRNYTRAHNGANNVFDINPGVDGIIGSADDVRGDDGNLHWFISGTNNPFILAEPTDFTSYSRDLADLPPGDLFPANADRDVAAQLGFPNTEAAMQQGAFFDEEQRTLGHDDVATLRLGMSGLDEIEGTADDYVINLVYEGVTTNCDIVVRLINSGSFAFCSTTRSQISGNHWRLTSASVTTGDFNWFFTTELVQIDDIFADSFESGDTTRWSFELP